MRMPEDEEWFIIGFIVLFITTIVIVGIVETAKTKRERAGEEITIIDKKVDGEARLIIYKTPKEDIVFSTVYETSNGWGIFSILKVGGKYKVSIRKKCNGESKHIIKIIKVISEPIAVKESYDPYKALTNVREGKE